MGDDSNNLPTGLSNTSENNNVTGSNNSGSSSLATDTPSDTSPINNTNSLGSSPAQPVPDPLTTPVITSTQDVNPDKTVQPPTTGEVTTVVTSPHAPQKYGGKKVIATIFGILLVLGGIGAGVSLVQRQQNISERAQEIQNNRRVDARCSEVKIYDQNWNQIDATSLGNLTVGEVVRFTVSGTATSGSFDKARFTINGNLGPEVTTKKPGTEEFYYEYTIPGGTVDFTVKGQVHHTVWGWI